MPPLSRRDALQGGGVICAITLAGCVSVSQSDQQETRLTGIELENHTADEQSVLVIVEDDGEQVYGEFTAVQPADDDAPEVRAVPDLPGTSGVYDVYFNLARRPEKIEGEFWARAENTDADCREYRVTIREDDDGDPMLGVYRSDGC